MIYMYLICFPCETETNVHTKLTQKLVDERRYRGNDGPV